MANFPSSIPLSYFKTKSSTQCWVFYGYTWRPAGPRGRTPAHNQHESRTPRSTCPAREMGSELSRMRKQGGRPHPVPAPSQHKARAGLGTEGTSPRLQLGCDLRSQEGREQQQGRAPSTSLPPECLGFWKLKDKKESHSSRHESQRAVSPNLLFLVP